jgi:hypothetical protein
MPQAHRTHSGRRAKRTLAIYFSQRLGGPTCLFARFCALFAPIVARIGHGTPLRSRRRRHRADDAVKPKLSPPSPACSRKKQHNHCAELRLGKRHVDLQFFHPSLSRGYASPASRCVCDVSAAWLRRTNGFFLGDLPPRCAAASVAFSGGRKGAQFFLAFAQILRRLLRGSGMEPLCDHAVAATERMMP